MPHRLFKRWSRASALVLVMAMSVAACGSEPGSVSVESPDANSARGLVREQDAARFLTQATFGPTDASIREVQKMGYEGWIDHQFTLQSDSHLAYIDNIRKGGNQNILPEHFYESFWKNASQEDAQLRERVKFALSEIFVISLADPNVNIDGAASYYDMLGDNAFGTYRKLLEQVALHPQMGIYLTHMANERENLVTGRKPDENFAREIMQLMSLGTVRLKENGTPDLSKGGPLPTYTPDDIRSLAKVFTGFSWYSPTAAPNDEFFRGSARHDPRLREIHTRPMVAYERFHSTSNKTLLGRVIQPGSANAELKQALDLIAAHSSAPPFMAHRLIQRLVTSNPSPAYVERVAKVFKNTNGDMKAVIKAILLDPEATAIGNSRNSGKIREPIIRLANWMRAFEARSESNSFKIESTSQNTSLGQSPLTSPSVFNFYRPGYVPPNTLAGSAGLTVPEFQIVDEVTVAGYVNFMHLVIAEGVGVRPARTPGEPHRIQPKDVNSTYANEIAIAHNAGALADRMNKLLMYGQMPDTLRQHIINSVNSRPIPTDATKAEEARTARLDRVKLAIYLTMISPDYLVQR